MRIWVLLLLISGSVRSQQTIQKSSREFMSIVRVEDAEKYYNEMLAKNPSISSGAPVYNDFRAQLAVDWLIKGDIEKYQLYKKTNPEFGRTQLLDLSNLLEEWVDENKNIKVVEQISKQLIKEVKEKRHNDPYGRMVALLEINAMANARLGNVNVAMSAIKEADSKFKDRDYPYMRNALPNFLNRYAAVLSAAGQHQRALDTLSAALRKGNSTARTVGILKEVYPKAKGSISGMDQYIKELQDEAYHKVYKEVEREWIDNPKIVPDVAMTDMDGNSVKLSEYRGRIVVVDLWSTGCKPCVAAFPAFERVVDLYKEEPFRLFVLNIGEDRETIQTYMNKKGHRLQVLMDDNEAMFKALNAIGTPQKYIIDADGKINLTGIGYAGSDDKEFYKLKAMVEITKNRSRRKATAS